MTVVNPNTSTSRHRERLLVRGVNWLGDAIMTTPALERLRESHPHAFIAMLTPEKLAGLWSHLPWVDDLIVFAPTDTLRQVAKRLRSGRFDTALVLPNSVRSALECWLAGIPQRIGYQASWRRWLLTQALPLRPSFQSMRKKSPAEIRRLIAHALHIPHPLPPVEAHHLFNYLHLATALGAQSKITAPRLFVHDDELSAVATQFGLDPARRPVLGINPGAEYGSAKRWPATHFEAAALEIHHHTRCQCLILGGPADQDLAVRIETTLNQSIRNQTQNAGSSLVINAAGKTSLRELCVLLKNCRVLLTNDTGPMHVAAAVGTAVVVPFGSTSPELTGPGVPGDTRHRLLKTNTPCAPCFLRQCPIDFRCMQAIEPQQAVQAVLQLWPQPSV